MRTWVPELAGLSARFIHEPWRAPAEELRRAGIMLGGTYPPPLVDHAVARDRALAAFRGLRAQAAIEALEPVPPRTNEENHMTVSAETAARLAARIEGYRDEMVEFQCRLTAVTALGPENGGDGEWLRSRHLMEQLRAFGLDQIEEIDAPDPRVSTGLRPNLVVRLPGAAARPAVWVLAHMDTVPPGEIKLWESDPFQAVVRDGRIIGRGVEDNQQGLTAGVFALRALLDEGLVPATDVGLVLVADEETGNHFGVEYMLETTPTWCTPTIWWWSPTRAVPTGRCWKWRRSQRSGSSSPSTADRCTRRYQTQA